jgi:RimJ/RimL family protein N-acetyltransferase
MNRNGVGGLAIYLSRLIFWRGYDDNIRRIFLFVLETPRPSAKSIKAAERHTFRFATIDDLERYKEDPVWDISDSNIQTLKNGDRCLLQLDGDNLVGYAWLAASSLVEIMWGFHFNMNDDIVYNYKGFTAPAYRGMGFQPLRHIKLLEHVKETGQRRLFGFVDHMNLNSLKGLKKSGYKRVGILCAKRTNDNIRFHLKVTENTWSKIRRT